MFINMTLYIYLFPNWWAYVKPPRSNSVLYNTLDSLYRRPVIGYCCISERTLIYCDYYIMKTNVHIIYFEKSILYLKYKEL